MARCEQRRWPWWVLAPVVAVVVLAAPAATAQPSPGPADPEGRAPDEGLATPDAAPLSQGEDLYLTGCVSCHGVGGVGSDDGPPLIGVGEASPDFYLRTGRMPLLAPAPQPPTKPPAYTDEQIRALVDYVASLGPGGEPIPDPEVDDALLSEGRALYLANCAACHNSAGIGGAINYGRYAPSLRDTPPVQVAEAVRIGPGQMPRFDESVLSDQQLDALVTYVDYLGAPADPGGFDLGTSGPVAEGFVAFTVGLALLVWAIRWITRDRGPARA